MTASEVAINELAGTIISEFLGKLRLSIAISIASVPFPHPMQYLVPIKLEKFCSNNFK